MTDQGIKSRPVYETLRFDRSGLRHLLVVSSPDHAFPLDRQDAETVEVWFVHEKAREAVTSVPVPDVRRSFRSPRHLLDRLSHRLASERMGFRLYARGTEDFLWDVYGLAQRAGMNKQEVFLCHAGSRLRRVLCTHCRTFNDGVTTTIVRCGGCGAHLFVRDHFSRRLSAFMGVKVDAEVPGEVPAAEQAYL